ncbi:MAG: hypothetical protein AAFP82_22355, partial [Bacteroidota bacterium]
MNFLYVLLTMYLVLDVYTFFSLRSLFAEKQAKLIFSGIYVAASIFSIFSFYKVFEVVSRGSIFSDSSANIYLGIFFTMFVGKLVFIALILLQDVGRFLWGIGDGIHAAVTDRTRDSFLPQRRKFLTLA